MSVTTVRLSFSVAATGSDLRLIVSLDDTVIWDGYPMEQSTMVAYDFDDADECEHVLRFEMQGKHCDHTQISDTGEIIADRCVTISDIAFDNIALGYMFTEVSQYHHDTNGTTDSLIEPFYGVMGCNGRVEMRFSTPIYLWLLENM